jgi:hypothetical protein
VEGAQSIVLVGGSVGSFSFYFFFGVFDFIPVRLYAYIQVLPVD